MKMNPKIIIGDVEYEFLGLTDEILSTITNADDNITYGDVRIIENRLFYVKSIIYDFRKISKKISWTMIDNSNEEIMKFKKELFNV